MNKRVEEFLVDNASSSNKDSILIEAGLYDKVYMPEAEDGSFYLDEGSEYDYPESEYDPVKGKTVYYRKQPIKVTDEEYNAVRQHLHINESNTLADIITFVAYVIFLIGFIAGINVGNSLANRESDFNLLWAVIVWSIGVASGISMLWFAEVLKLLQDIKNKLRSDE